MPRLTFKPDGQTVEVDPGTKLLVAARRHKIDIRFGCGACMCGLCGVRVIPDAEADLSPMREREKHLLETPGLPVDGSVRLACQTKIDRGECAVDLDFQSTYSP